MLLHLCPGPLQNNLHILTFLSQDLILGKPNLRPDGVVGGRNLGSAPLHLSLNPSLRGYKKLILQTF